MKRATGEITVTSVGSDRPGHGEEHQDGLALAGQEIELACRAWVIQITAVSATRHADEGAEGDPEDIALDQVHEPGPDAGLLAIAGPAGGTSARNPHSSCDLRRFHGEALPIGAKALLYVRRKPHLPSRPTQAPRPAPQAPRSDGKWHDGSEREDRLPALRRARRRRPRGLRRRRPEARRRGARDRAEDVKDAIAGAPAAERFKGKPSTALTIPAPAGLSAERLIVVGIGGEKDRGKLDLRRSRRRRSAGRSPAARARWWRRCPGLAPAAEDIAQMALGARLRALQLRPLQDQEGGRRERRRRPGSPSRSRTRRPRARPRKPRDGLAEGVGIARDLVNEPPNVLGPEEFADRAAALAKLGVEVEVLDEKALRKLGMRALLAVGQGSRAREPGRHHALERRQGRATSRSPSSARAWCSIPAASRSSPAAAWRT